MNEQNEKHDSLLDEVTRDNPSISFSIIDAYQKLERKLLKLGVKVEGRYNIEHPLGSSRNRFYALGSSRGNSYDRRD